MTSGQDVWLVVTAHPDDESMFFIPTLRNLLGSSTDGPTIQLLCLSNGDYNDPSDGPIRNKEMHEACSVVGVRNGRDSPSAVTVMDDERMKDGPNEVWGQQVVAEAVLEHICKRLAPAVGADCGSSSGHGYILSGPDAKQKPWSFIENDATPTTTAEKESMQTINLNILTFDQGGVSGHRNHVDTFRGMQYLLNEKCCISREQKSESPRAKLRLCQGTSTAPGGNDTIHMELNVSVLTLRTISNPLQKYFLWAIVEIIPFLFLRLLQMILYLVYFLLGGILWYSKGGPQIQPFAGMAAFLDGNNMQCRIVEPILVWRAMAAHHSQFVWYRRLSVMFSRYTFINDLRKLRIDMPRCDNDDVRDDMPPLPPVVVVKEEEPTTKFLLNTAQINALREAVVPAALHHRPWKRLYSLSRDGDSFVAFQKTMEDWNRKPGDTSSTLLLVKTSGGELIGGFSDVPLVPTAEVVGSAARSCLFRIRPEQDGTPVIVVYGNHSSLAKKIVTSASRRIVAFGGGVSGGGPDEGFGLCLEDGFSRGTTAICSAFRNDPLVSGKDGVFDVLDVEVWGFVFGRF